MNARLRQIGLIALGAFAGLALAEVWVRAAPWTPPTQVVRGNCLHSVDGVPVWGCENNPRNPDDVRNRNRVCVEEHPERTRILFFGSSITYGYGVNSEELFTRALEVRLNRLQPTPGFCVLNFAEPGFHFEQNYAVARIEAPRYRPALIMWESAEDSREYRLYGDAAYGVTGYQLRPDGFIGIAGVPGWLNRTLFLRSHLYEYLALRYGERATGGLPEREGAIAFANNRLNEMVQFARSMGATIVLYRAPHLDRPFAETLVSPSPSDAVFREFFEALHVPFYSLARELIDYDYLQVRLDPCCHYNAAGHRALVQVMERIVLEQLGDGAKTE